MDLLMIGLCFFMVLCGVVHADPSQKKPQTVVILLGPPGSGKGTQATRLSKELNIPHISTGDLFRENLSKGTELGKKVKGFMESGNLVPDELVLEMLFDRVSREDCARGYLLDGFPRTIPQAEALDKYLKGKTNVTVLNLMVDDSNIVKRMSGRLTCKNCGSVYNKFFSPPAKAGVCDKCGGELVQRSDDKEEVVQERLKVYHTQTEPLIAYYGKQGLVADINGENAPNQVYKDLLSNLPIR